MHIAQPSTVVPDDFRTAAAHLRALADAMRGYPTLTDPGPAAGSRASQDEKDHTFDSAWGRPTFELSHEPAPRITAVADHLRGIAALTEAEQVILSIASLIRPAVLGLSVLYWLYDPDISRRERVRRRMNLRLQSLVEQQALGTSFGEGGAGASRLVARIEESAPRHGFTYKADRSRNPAFLGRRYLERPLPSDGELLAGLIDGSAQGQVGRVVHRVTSAVLHGQMHGLSPFILDHSPSEEPGVAIGSVGVSLAMYASLTGACVYGSAQTMERLINHFGWPRDPWDAAINPALASWWGWLTRT